jgi:hypothetical protein
MEEVSVCAGLLTEALRAELNQLKEQRLRPSSNSSIQTAWGKHWLPFVLYYGLPDFVSSGHPSRGGIMASFVLTLSKKELVYTTIRCYVWGVVDNHIKHGYASPVDSVRDWTYFMKCVEVETHVPAEPRRMVGWSTFVRALRAVDEQSVHEVGIACFMLILFYTFSRPELIPGTLDGKCDFDGGKHLRNRDVRIMDGHVQVCMRAIKQDPLCKRSHCVAGEAWRPVGNCTGILDLHAWLDLYFRLRGFAAWPADAVPLFVDSHDRPLTYGVATAYFRMLLKRIPDLPAEYLNLALGGIRSMGCAAVRLLSGDKQAQWIGQWGSQAWTDYDRALYNRTLELPPLMADMAARSALRGQLESLDDSDFLTQIDVEGRPVTQRVGAPHSRTQQSDTFEVGAIKDYCTTSRKYLVSWRGYDASHDTWEPRTHLRGCSQLLAAFDAAHAAPPQVPVMPPSAATVNDVGFPSVDKELWPEFGGEHFRGVLQGDVEFCMHIAGDVHRQGLKSNSAPPGVPRRDFTKLVEQAHATMAQLRGMWTPPVGGWPAGYEVIVDSSMEASKLKQNFDQYRTDIALLMGITSSTKRRRR